MQATLSTTIGAEGPGRPRHPSELADGPAAFADAIGPLRDPERRRSLGHEGRRSWKNGFLAERHCAFEELLEYDAVNERDPFMTMRSVFGLDTSVA
jgi:hypothetical protein